ncbi:hypothetical protein [Natrononativus amylolyticus]|uniref:hypothetical protein n=1 Tax=Natrononativus amylolyticus TaxID=2963434 RepID=UPI0020CED085|nr:hypothetical protein [Natrononativus amylolyticus]
MGIFNYIVSSGKFFIGMGIALVFIMVGVMSVFVAMWGGGAVAGVIGLVLIVVGGGLAMWAEDSRRSAFRTQARY